MIVHDPATRARRSQAATHIALRHVSLPRFISNHLSHGSPPESPHQLCQFCLSWSRRQLGRQVLSFSAHDACLLRSLWLLCCRDTHLSQFHRAWYLVRVHLGRARWRHVPRWRIVVVHGRWVGPGAVRARSGCLLGGVWLCSVVAVVVLGSLPVLLALLVGHQPLR